MGGEGEETEEDCGITGNGGGVGCVGGVDAGAVATGGYGCWGIVDSVDGGGFEEGEVGESEGGEEERSGEMVKTHDEGCGATGWVDDLRKLEE